MGRAQSNAESFESVAGARIIRSADELPLMYGCAFVPTMGGLHGGHLALVRQARCETERLAQGSKRPPVVVSVYVNPTQFNERSDYERYPRDVAADTAMSADAGADIVWAPDDDVVYPPGVEVPVPPIPPMAQKRGLEDEHRPGHLEGVCQVCARLFRLIKPHLAVFGEKDWQQLQMIRWLVRDLGLGVEILNGPTVRESDGLAMASRNRFLTPEERKRAICVPRAWQEAQRHRVSTDAEAAMRRVLSDAGATIDYAAIRDAQLLSPLPGGEYTGPAGSARAVLCARLGAVRLLDNAPWPG